MKNNIVMMWFLFAIFIKPVAAKDVSSLESIEWMLGEWRAESETRIITEKWIKASSITFEGSGQTQSKLDQNITDSEALRLVALAGDIFYIAKVSHNDFPIAFRLVSNSDHIALFENKGHDFPQQIYYKLIDKNHLHVTVSNLERAFDIQFTRTQ